MVFYPFIKKTLMMKTIVILSNKTWHSDLTENLSKKFEQFDFILINDQKHFSYSKIKKINPYKIFIPHWSNIIPEKIYLNFDCVLFHMTDLPFGRGGSPLQNLIKLGFTETKISAISVSKKLDAGPIFLKKKLSLHGSASDIFMRASNIIEKMINHLLINDIRPVKQKGPITLFKRRLPHESNIRDVNSIVELYDHIRMLDCDGYPKAFLELNNFKIEFINAQINDKNEIKADVRIFKK